MIVPVLTDSSAEARRVVCSHRALGEPVLVVNKRHVPGISAFEGQVQAATCVASDMDGTATVDSVWKHLMAFLDEETAARNYADYRAAQESGEPRRIIAQTFQSVKDLANAGFSHLDMERAAAGVQIRRGWTPLMATFREDCRCVISHGLRDPIEQVLTLQPGLELPPKVYALHLRWAADRQLIQGGASPYVPETVVIDANKGFVLDMQIADWEVEPEEVLVLTDSPNDQAMRDPGCTVVTLFPMNDKDPNRDRWREEAFDEMWNASSALLFADNWDVLLRIRRF